jgi:hypothetical protein
MLSLLVDENGRIGAGTGIQHRSKLKKWWLVLIKKVVKSVRPSVRIWPYEYGNWGYSSVLKGGESIGENQIKKL